MLLEPKKDPPIRGGFMDLPQFIQHDTREPEVVNFPDPPSALPVVIRRVPVLRAISPKDPLLTATGTRSEKWVLGKFQSMLWVPEREEVEVGDDGLAVVHQYGYKRVLVFHVWYREGDLPPTLKQAAMQQVAAQQQNGDRP